MKRKHWLALISALVVLALTASLAAATAYHTIIVDGDMGDWAVDEFMETDAGYGLYLTWDATSIYLGLTGADLGDDPVLDKSFFVCFDTDQVPGSGALGDGYGNVLFSASIAPEYCYYFAGGAGWYEWTSWNGASWDWNGWRDDGTFYHYPGNPAANPGSEFTILRNDIGNPISVAVIAWLTPEQPVPSALEASWPTSNPIGTLPILTDAYFYANLFYDGVSPNIAVEAQGDHVVINELDNYTEWLELYNPTGTSVDIGNWHLTADYDGLDYTIPAGIVLPPGGYWTYNTSGDMNNGGDVISLYDDGAALVDQVGYGNYGGAPAPSTVWRTMARVPNGTDTDDDAQDWNLTTTPTAGTVNNAPPVLLGSSLLLNEFDNYPVSGNDMVEIYNPTGDTVSLTDWYLSDGDAVAPIVTSISVPPGGWVVLEELVDWTVSMDFSSADVGYLFEPDGTRVDQIGWAGEYEDNTFQRICDGDGPNDGYDWPSSGGGVTWFDLPDTLGGTNTPGPVDMTVEKIGPTSVAPGGVITYVISYWAVYPMPTTPFSLVDTLPPEVELIGYEADPPLSELGTDPLWLDGGAQCGLPAGVITITGQVTDTIQAGDVITNEVEINATGDLTPTNDIAQWETTITSMDLTVVKTGPADPLWPGDTISYTISYILDGNEDAVNVTISDTFPAGFTGVTYSAPPTLSCTLGADDLVCSAATLAESGEIILTGTVPAMPDDYVITNTVEVEADNDGDPLNNEDKYINRMVMPIEEIQYVPDPASDDASPYVGQHVWTEGVVTVDSDDLGGFRYFIQDPAGGPWSGLYVYHDGDRPPVQEGDWVLAYGEIAEYYGLTEFDLRDSADGQQHIISSTNPLPAPEILSTGEYTSTSPNTAEPYEGALIEFQAATVINDDLGYGEWLFDDGTGSARADDMSSALTYVPAIGDYYAYIRGLGYYGFDDYKIVPRYDDDIEVDYLVTLVYHDLEDVVPPGESVYVAGDFNGWNAALDALAPDAAHSVFSITFQFDFTGTYEYKYVVYTDTVPNEMANWNWLQSNNRSVFVNGPTFAHDYRNIEPGYVVLQGPHATTATVGIPTENIYGQIWADDLTSRPGEARALLAEVAYGNDPDPATWMPWQSIAWDSQQGNNDEYAGPLPTPTATGVYSYVVRFNGNWGDGNPHDTWYYGDTDGVYPGEPFEMANAGVLTVIGADLTIDKTVAPKEGVTLGSVVTYTILMDSIGDGDALGVVMTDVLPVEVDFGGWVSQSGATVADDTINWMGDIEGHTSVLIAFTVTVGMDEAYYGRGVTNIAEFSSDNAGTGSDETGFPIEEGLMRIYLPIVLRGG